MQALRHFSIPFKGLKIGTHKYEFEILNSFFNEFEASPISKGNIKVELNLERKHDHLILEFEAFGYVNTDCDRCTANINLPLDYSFQYIIKYDENEREEDEIVFINPERHEINVAALIYEQTILALPIVKVYDCQDTNPEPCNQEVLKVLYRESEDEVSEEVKNNPFGDVLKDLKITKTK
jgi:uncharacterized metal-binding protein YceD (DUF177 family)